MTKENKEREWEKEFWGFCEAEHEIPNYHKMKEFIVRIENAAYEQGKKETQEEMLKVCLENEKVSYLKGLKDAMEVVEIGDKYIELLQDEIKSMIGLAYVHGWRSSAESINSGEELRKLLFDSKSAITKKMEEYE